MKKQFLNRFLILSVIILAALSCKKETIVLPAGSTTNTTDETTIDKQAAKPGPVITVPIKISLTANVYSSGILSRSVDIDNDGINDFTFTIGVSRTNSYYQIATYIETRVQGGGVLSAWEPTVLDGNPSSWLTYPVAQNYMISAKDKTYASPSLPSTYYYSFDFFARKGGSIIGAGNKMVGMRYVSGGQTYYGCLKINVSSNGRTFTIINAAHNSTPDIPFMIREIE